MTTLAICRFMKGWRYEWVADLPVDVKAILIEEMLAMQNVAELPD